MYIEHIVWRFVKHRPEEYRLLDVRHNVMKNFIIKHIPRSVLWKKEREFVKDDDLKPFENEDDKSNERDVIIPTNDMELAIYHCKGKISICL